MDYYSNRLERFHTQIKINSVTGSELIANSVAKDYMRVDTSTDDTLIGQMVKQARIYVENYISRDIVAKTRSLYLATVNERFSLPFAPIASIQSITVDGSSTSNYKTYGLDDLLVEMTNMPVDNVIVNYTTAGFDNDLVKQAMLQLISTYYDNRSDFIEGRFLNMIPTNVKDILSSEKIMYI